MGWVVMLMGSWGLCYVMVIVLVVVLVGGVYVFLFIGNKCIIVGYFIFVVGFYFGD